MIRIVVTLTPEEHERLAKFVRHMNSPRGRYTRERAVREALRKFLDEQEGRGGAQAGG